MQHIYVGVYSYRNVYDLKQELTSFYIFYMNASSVC